MSRLTIPARDEAPANSQPLLDGVFKKLGIVPNLFRVFAQSPAALRGLLGLAGANSKMLDVKTRERIAIAVAGHRLRLLPVGAHLHRHQARQDHAGRRGA